MLILRLVGTLLLLLLCPILRRRCLQAIRLLMLLILLWIVLSLVLLMLLGLLILVLLLRIPGSMCTCILRTSVGVGLRCLWVKR